MILLSTGCTNPKDARLRGRENRANVVLEAAVHRETRARIRSVACTRIGDEAEVCKVSFRGGRPTERWKLVYTRDSARVRRTD